jgi:hypothetical protein
MRAAATRRFESKSERPLRRATFAWRLVVHIFYAACLLSLSLAAGMFGYAHFENMAAIDAFLNASMILSGMGPITSPSTPGGKLFAGCYAIYSGLLFVVSVGLILTPVAHRILHKFHADSAL